MADTDLTPPKLAREDLLVLDNPSFHGDTVAIVTGGASGIGRATVVETVDIDAGVFETFTNESITVDAVLAAAVSNLFEAVEVHGHLHWDGLFSQNPPVDDLLAAPMDHKPQDLGRERANAFLRRRVESTHS